MIRIALHSVLLLLLACKADAPTSDASDAKTDAGRCPPMAVVPCDATAGTSCWEGCFPCYYNGVHRGYDHATGGDPRTYECRDGYWDFISHAVDCFSYGRFVDPDCTIRFEAGSGPDANDAGDAASE